ncbi:MAG: FAD-dependent oxidoreductase [Patescibacteria group bacterium]
MTTKTVVIIGGGFGGVRAALDSARHKYDLRVVLIDKNGFHSYPADYYKLLSPSSDHKEHFGPAKFRLMFSSVSISLAEIFEGHENVELLTDEVMGFDAGQSIVNLASGESVKYDWLIIAAGSVTNFYDIPGLRARALEFKTTADSLNVRNAVDEVFERKGKKDPINIVIGGGGFTGCEVASELVGYADNLSKIHGHPRDSVFISIIEASPTLLGPLSDWAKLKTNARLKKLGVNILFSDPAVDVRDSIVKLKSGKEINFDVLIWTAGVKANPLGEKIVGLELNRGCIVVDRYLRTSAGSNIYAVGDISFYEGLGGKPMPMTSQTAISQAKYVAYSIKRQLHGRKIFKYHPRESKFIMPLGGKYAIADLGFIKFSGFLPWLLKRFVALGYFLSILTFSKAIKIWLKGARF